VQVGFGSPSSDVQNSPGRQVWSLHDIPTSLRRTHRTLAHTAFAPAQATKSEQASPSTGKLWHVPRFCIAIQVTEAESAAVVAWLAGIDRPVTAHGIRHSFYDLARQQGVPDAVVKAMAGRAGTEVAQRGQDKHLHDRRA
jgi:hypothetical protein